jgi:hypothetical protein
MSSPAPCNLSLPSFWLDDPVDENLIPFVDIPGKAIGRHASRSRRDLHSLMKRRKSIPNIGAVGVEEPTMNGLCNDAVKLVKDVDGLLLSGWQSVSASAEEGIINALPSSLADIISKSSSSSSSHHHDNKKSRLDPQQQQHQRHERLKSSHVVDSHKRKDYFGDEGDNADDKFSLIQLGSEKRREYIDSHRKLFCNEDDENDDDSYSVSSSCSSSSSSFGSVAFDGDDDDDNDSTRLWALPRNPAESSSSTKPTYQLLVSNVHGDTVTTSSTVDNIQFKFTSRDSKQRRRSGYSTLPADSLTIDRIEDQSQSRREDRFFIPDAFDDDDDDDEQSSSHSDDSTESASLDLLDVDSDDDGEDDEDDIVVVLEKQRNAIVSHFGTEYRELSSRLECALMMRFSGHYPIPQLLLWFEGCITQINASNIFITGMPLDLALVATFINKWMSVSDHDFTNNNNNSWASLFMVICYKVHCLTFSYSAAQSVTSAASPSPSSQLNLKTYAPKNSSSLPDILASFKEWSSDVIHDMISSTILAGALVHHIQKNDSVTSSLLTSVGRISSQIVLTSTQSASTTTKRILN